MNSDISRGRKAIVIGWTVGFALVMGFSMAPFTLHVFWTFFPSPAAAGEMLFGLVPLVTAQTYALQALFILVELISTNLFVGVWRARGLPEGLANLGAAMMIALLAIVAAWTDNRTVAHAQVEANYSREIAGKTQPDLDQRAREGLETWQKQIDQFIARIDRSQAAIDKIQKDLDAQNGICNYPPTLVARDNACAQVKRLGGEKEAETAQKRLLENDLRALQNSRPARETGTNAIPNAAKYASDLEFIIATIDSRESLFSLGLALVVFFFLPLGNGAFIATLEGGRRKAAVDRAPAAFQLELELERLAHMPAELQVVSAASLQMVIATVASASARGHAASEATAGWELKFAHEVDRLRAAADLKRRIARYRGITLAARTALIEGIDRLFEPDPGKPAPTSA